MKKREVDTTNIKMVNNLFTSTAFGITDTKNNQIWGFYSGADSLSDHLSVFEVSGKVDFGIIAPNNPRAMIKFAKEYQQSKTPYLFDPGMQLPWLTGTDLREAFKGAKIIVGNDYEMSVMAKKIEKEVVSFAKEEKIVITTLGGEGSKINYRDEEIRISIARVKNISDPAGAGDAYRAGFISGFMRGFPLKVCGQMGSVTSAYAVEKFGTTTHSFTVEEFMRRYKENYREEIKL